MEKSQNKDLQVTQYKKVVKFLPKERWYGGNVVLGSILPIRAGKPYYINDYTNRLYNQSAPFYVSTKGRYVWCDSGMKVKVIANKIIFKSNKSEIYLHDGYHNLRNAYLEASKRYFPANGNMPPETKFIKPQYCTWVELIDNQNQKDIIDYAKSIVDKKMPVGELIIDDGWQNDFGDWSFKKETFPEPKKMIDELKSLGFSVSLWICPFVQPGSIHENFLKENDCLVKDSSGEYAIRKWWNGASYVLDLTNPDAVQWFKDQCQSLIDEYGIDGFKQDAGDAFYYRDDDITFEPTSANEQSINWARLAHTFKYNELRACWKCGGEGIAQRLSDKLHRWIRFVGLRSLVPNMLALGMIGHPYSCPDMIGGGMELDFAPGKKFDFQLIIRYAQCAALMPMMQYSKSFWNINSGIKPKFSSRKITPEQTSQLCVATASLHAKYQDYIIQLAKEAKDTCEPIIRYLEYQYPGEGLENRIFDFALGDKYIVAPMVWKKKKRKVKLPKGKWLELNSNQVYDGGKTYRINNPLEILLVFEKQ